MVRDPDERVRRFDHPWWDPGTIVGNLEDTQTLSHMSRLAGTWQNHLESSGCEGTLFEDRRIFVGQNWCAPEVKNVLNVTEIGTGDNR